MTIRSRIAAAAIAAVTLTGAFAATSQEAHASKFGTGLAIGIGAGALIASGAYAHGYYGHGYYAPVRCHWEKRFNAYGYYIGKVRVCH
jgi:ABC-type sugar transport system substrate-binding protein